MTLTKLITLILRIALALKILTLWVTLALPRQCVLRLAKALASPVMLFQAKAMLILLTLAPHIRLALLIKDK